VDFSRAKAYVLVMKNFPTHAPAAVLATILTVNVRTISKLVAKGVFKKSAHGFHIAESVAAYVNYMTAQQGGGVFGKAKTQWMQEKARTARLIREEREKKLIPMVDVMDLNGKCIVTARNAFMSLPTRYAPRLVNLRTPGDAQKVLDPACRAILTDLQEMWRGWLPPEEDNPDVKN
jgi:hypothetical protein